jgi:hypothetical protein
MKNFLDKIKKHHQIPFLPNKIDKNVKVLITFVRSQDGTLGVDMFENYEEIDKNTFGFYIYDCSEIQVFELE